MPALSRLFGSLMSKRGKIPVDPANQDTATAAVAEGGSSCAYNAALITTGVRWNGGITRRTNSR